MAVSGIANIQLSVLQLPEVARLEVPVLASAQLANAEAPAIIALADRRAAEMVQFVQELDRRGVSNAADDTARRESTAYRWRQRSPRLGQRVVALAAVHPFGVGSLVDFRA